MHKYFIIFVVLLITGEIATAQLANQNTYLLRQLDSYGSGYSALWGYTAPNGREYAILGCNTGTSFVDITDSANIREVDFVTGVQSGWREMKTYSHYAYVVSEGTNSRLQIIDLQYLPDSVSLVTTWSYSGYTKTHSIQQYDHYLYLNGGNAATTVGGVAVVDVINPTSPVKLGQWSTEYVHDCRVKDDTIWVANIYSGKISIINATNKSNLEFVRSFQEYPQSTVSTHNCDFSPDGKYLYATNEIQSPVGKLSIWDITDRTNIVFVRNWQPTGITTSIVHNVEIYGNIAVVAHYTAGIRILSITDPSNPTEIAWYDTYTTNNSANFSGCWGVYKFPSGKIVGSDISGGLFVIKTTFPLTGTGNESELADNYSLSQNYPNPFNPETKINFSLKDHSQVTLKIFDVNGKEVAALFNDRRDAGNYEVKLNAAKYGLTSGTYFYSLFVNNSKGSFKETKKMLLIK